MANSTQLRVSKRNIYWAIAVALAAVIGWLIGGWKIALAGAIVLLVVSEVVERRARAQRLAARE